MCQRCPVHNVSSNTNVFVKWILIYKRRRSGFTAKVYLRIFTANQFIRLKRFAPHNIGEFTEFFDLIECKAE